MVRNILSKFLLAAAVSSSANAYFLFAMNDVITTERIDPIVNPGKVSGHVHTVVGGSHFRVSTNTSYLRQSECTSSPIKEDKSNYWAPTLYFQWKNGSFSSVNGSPVIYYLYSDTPGTTTVFPDDFRMLSGTPTLRSYDASSYAQQAITFLCLDFNGVSTRFNQLPAQSCPSGIRAQINFPSCWDGVNSDSPDHKSHVAFLSGGPDSGTCSDPKFPKTLPRIFMEMYLDTASWDSVRDQAMNPSQPFVYSMGDPTGYGYHADFIFGWDKGVLENVVDKCQCTSAGFGDPTCCSTAGYFTFKSGGNCRITKGVNEITTGTLATLPGNNPVVGLNGVASNLAAPVTPALIEPVYAYTGDSPTQTGTPVGPPVTAAGGGTPAAGTTSTPVAVSSAKATSTKGASTTKNDPTSASVPASSPSSDSGSKGAPTTKDSPTSASVPASSPSSGSGSPGSGSYGSGSGPYGSGSGSAPPANNGGSSSSNQGSGTNSPSNGTSSNSGSYGSGSGSGSQPANGGSGSPSQGSSPNSGTPTKGSNPSSGSSHTCKKKTKRAAAHGARAMHASRRRFASPAQRFVNDDF